ncbi:MAG: hypothetical protein JNK40_02775 [Chromatiales bacterium]|nr:hypothetical protein [Chromatiales bacterium]
MKISFVHLDGKGYVYIVDNERRRQKVWRLDDDTSQWIPAENMADVLFNGRLMSEAEFGKHPPLPSL